MFCQIGENSPNLVSLFTTESAIVVVVVGSTDNNDKKKKMSEHAIPFHRHQCDHVGLFSKGLGQKNSYRSSQNFVDFLG